MCYNIEIKKKSYRSEHKIGLWFTESTRKINYYSKYINNFMTVSYFW